MEKSRLVCGIEYSFRAGAACGICGRSDLPTIAPGRPRADGPVSPPREAYLCEPCSIVIAWAWRSEEGPEVYEPFQTTPSASLVFVAREQKVDYETTTEVLLVERKDSPGHYGLPGGKVEEEEGETAAAVRKLREETGLHTWESALESLYVGFSLRSRLVSVFLCRGYAGQLSSPETPALWMPWPVSDHSGPFAGFYVGCQNAYQERKKLQTAAGAKTSALSVHLPEFGTKIVDLTLKSLDGPLSDDESRHLAALSNMLTVDEKSAVDIIASNAMKTLNEEET